MPAVLALLFFLIPIAELAVIIAAGELIGYGPTILLLIAISVAGAVLAKREGSAVWKRFRAAINRGEVPSAEIIDGFLVLLGAALLLTPGFLTDVIGLLMLVPGPRSWFKNVAVKLSKLLIFKRFPVAGAAAAGRDVWQRRRAAKVVKVTSSGPRQAPGEPPSTEGGEIGQGLG